MDLVISDFHKTAAAIPGITPEKIAYIENQLSTIKDEADPAKAAQTAYDLMVDFNHANVGGACANALLTRPDGEDLAANVGAGIVKNELLNSSLQPSAFVRGNQAINGFSRSVVNATSPLLETQINDQIKALKDKYDLSALHSSVDQNVKHTATVALANDFVQMSTATAITPATASFLKSMKAAIMEVGNYAYDQNLVRAINEKNTPADKIKDPDFVPPPVSAEDLRKTKATLADSFTNNSSALRIIGPALGGAKADDGSELRKNSVWGGATQASQKTINAYSLDRLDPGGLDPIVAKEVFSADNKAKVREMHQQVDDARIAPSLGVDLRAVSHASLETRKMAIAAQTIEQPAIEHEQIEQPVTKTSVRDMLRGAANRVSDAASTLKNAVGTRLNDKGSEQKLSEVSPEKVEAYKALQQAVKEMDKLVGEIALDAAMGDDQANVDYANAQPTETIARMMAEMAEMRNEDPGLKQLDRSKVGQVVHSGIRDAAKTVGSRLHT